jgi:exosortase/archaeosortase family protein
MSINGSDGNAKINLIYYALLSLFVYLEIFISSSLLFPGLLYDPLKHGWVNVPWLLSGYYIWFLLFNGLLIFIAPNKTNFLFRQRVQPLYLSFHLFTFFLLILCFLWMGYHSFQPLKSGEFLFEFLQFRNISFSEWTIRFGIPLILLIAGLHYTLILSAFDHKKIYTLYLLSIALVLPGVLLWKLFRHLNQLNHLYQWMLPHVTKVVFLLIKLTGLKAYLYLPLNTSPILGTDMFKVSIAPPCSGMEGISAFFIAFFAIVLINLKRINLIHSIVIAYVGTLIMYLTNILRIYILILIGHFYGPGLAVDLFHSAVSIFIYAIIVIAILGVSYEWMHEVSVPKTEIPRDTLRS